MYAYTPYIVRSTPSAKPPNYVSDTELGQLVNRGSRSQWPSGLGRVSTADRLLGLRVRIPPGAWMVVRCECCVCCQVEVSATD